MSERRSLIDSSESEISIRRQCELLGLTRSTFYYTPAAVYPKRRTTIPDKEHRIYPYLLRGLEISRPNVV